MPGRKFFHHKKSPYSLGSIFQLSILIFGLVMAVFLTDQAQKYVGRATSSPKPQEVKITNLAEGSFTVSWLTDKPATGVVILKDSSPTSPEKVFFDDRSGSYTTNSLFSTHEVTVRSLQSNKAYLFQIQSGKEKYGPASGGVSYQITTLSPTETIPGTPMAVYGNITDNNQSPSAGILVYLITPNSLPLSSLSDQNGNFILSPTNSRSKDLKTFYLPKENDQATLILTSDTKTSLKKDLVLSGTDQNLGNFILAENNSLLTTPLEKNTINLKTVPEKLNFFQRIVLFLKNLLKIQ